MFDEVIVVDYDIVGEENVSYQELFAVEDVGMPKALAASRRALQSAPLSRIYVVNSEIPLRALQLVRADDPILLAGLHGCRLRCYCRYWLSSSLFP